MSKITENAQSLPALRLTEFTAAHIDARGRITKRYRGEARAFVEDLDGLPLEMIEIWSGEFWMGSPESEGDADERPLHLVKIASFYLGKFQITQRQWRVVASWPKVLEELEPDPACFKGNDQPVEQVSWQDALEFCARLARRFARPYRLPSEAEWEYACRAGSATPFAFGKGLTAKLANYDGSVPQEGGLRGICRHTTVPVGSLGCANEFGLYDMHGNVWEWCRDNWHDNYENAPTDGSAWDDGASPLRVLRGGSWDYPAYGCRSAFRDRGKPHVRSPFNGLRVAMSATF